MTNEKPPGRGRRLSVLDGGMGPGGVVRGGVRSEVAPPVHGQLDLAKELREALAGPPYIDYEHLRADLDAVADPSPKDWYAFMRPSRALGANRDARVPST